jgi:hypothetical protein
VNKNLKGSIHALTRHPFIYPVRDCIFWTGISGHAADQHIQCVIAKAGYWWNYYGHSHSDVGALSQF